MQREPPLGEMLRAGEASPGELLDLAQPVAERLFVHVHLGRGALPGAIGADKRAHGVNVVRPMRAVVGKQVAEHLIDQRLGLGRASRHEQPGAIAVTDQRDRVGLGNAQRPERLLHRVGRPVRRSHHVADAHAAAWLAGRMRRQRRDMFLRHHRVKQIVAPEQQAGDMRPRAGPVHRVLGACHGDPQREQHAHREIWIRGSRLPAGRPPAPVRIEQLREQLGAPAPVALTLGNELRELDRASDRDVLEHRDTGQPPA